MAGPSLAERGIDPAASDSGPALMMRLLIQLPANVPSYFRELALHPAMGAALWRTVEELRLAGLGSTDLRAEAFVHPDKHAELVALLEAYAEHLRGQNLADRATVFHEALQHQDEAPTRESDPWLECPDVLWPPLVRQLLDALPGQRLTPQVARVPGGKRPRRLQDAPVDEQDTGSALSYLLSPAEVPEPPAPEQLQMFRTGGQEAEVEEVFRRILHGNGSTPRFDQVEIACASPDYVPLVWEKAQRHGWPTTLATGLPVALTRPARALLAWCDWVGEGFPAAGLRRLLLSGDIHLDIKGGPRAGRAARLLLRAEATWGRVTYDSRLTALAAAERRRASDPEVETEEAERRTERADQADRLRDWIKRLLADAPDVGSGEEVSLAAVVSAARTFVERFAASGSDTDAQAKQAVVTALDELKTLGSVERPIPGCLDLVRSALEGVTVAASRARPGHLHVTGLRRAGFAGRPHTFVVGLREGRVIPLPVEDPVLLDAERTALDPSLPTSFDRVEEAVHATLARLAVLGGGEAGDRGTARSTCVLSYSCRDLREYRETFPSWLILQARRLQVPGQDVTYEALAQDLGEPVSMVPDDPARALTTSGWWLNGLRRIGPRGMDALLASFPRLHQGRHAEQQRSTSVFTEFDGLVPDAADALDPRRSGLPISASRLEMLAKCPFSYFLQNGLGLRPLEDSDRDPDEWLDPLTRGGLLHALYAEVMRRLRRADSRRGARDPLSQAEWLRQEASARLDQLRQEVPPPSEAVFERDRDQILRDVELFLKYEQDHASDGREAVGFEVGFGVPHHREEGDEEELLAQSEPVEIALGQLRFLLRGRIDRIDRLKANEYEVIDYKTGSYYRPAFKGVFNGGRLLQHALYGLAAAHLLRQHDPSARITTGTYYFPSSKGGAQKKRIRFASSGQISQVLSDLLDGPAAGAFLHSPDEGDCRFCDLHAACGGQRKGNGADLEKAPAARARARAKLDACQSGQSPRLQSLLRARAHD